MIITMVIVIIIEILIIPKIRIFIVITTRFGKSLRLQVWGFVGLVGGCCRKDMVSLRGPYAGPEYHPYTDPTCRMYEVV